MSVLTKTIREFVNEEKLAFIAAVCPDGTPNLSPNGTVRAWDDNHLVFADIHSPNTIENLLYNSAIEINVVDIFTRKGFRFKGHADVLSEGELFKSILTYYKQGGTQQHIASDILYSLK
ncbi:pyridoxamine 5'-phosphate oxidase family protein [Fulvivirga sp. 29W222]|uniref:Pyridoxamine 5'-phosphate oxidase family protein n=1 Tax=Fulvivirga marina TaxID=2494733 RepID=A0A937KFQ1_9BACT|nr:pyridoxamine 5'-phosphate oxidase family protein [Fulvivirga marina]MBL6448520.1 pyridoxamine 5'-phosphate oxidase family protein [Fulvivirga marina]